MSRAVSAIFFLVLLVTGAFAQAPDTEAAKRKQVAPLIRALTDCIAKEAADDSAAPSALKSGTFSSFAPLLIRRCSSYVADLLRSYDRAYGDGEASVFIKGPYSSDLPRAVLARIRPLLEAKIAKLDRDEAERAVRYQEDIRSRQDEARRVEAERQRQIAEAQQQAASARAAAAQADAEAKVIAAKAEADRLQRLEVAKKAESLLADKAADCARRQLRSLVRSGESAEVLASAVMTICGTEFGNMIQAGTENLKSENGLNGSSLGDKLLNERLRAQARDLIIALAVQAKAGVGAFAPASTN